MKRIRILLVDDHTLMRHALVSLLGTRKELEVIGDVGDGKAALVRIQDDPPDVVIMDLMMPDMDGTQTTRKILELRPEAKVLVLTTFGTSDGIAGAIDAGARGAVLKSADLDELCKAITAVAEGRTYLSAEIEQIMTEDPPLPKLSPRQADILASITRGLTNTDIARQFGISLPVVKEHLSILFQKIGVSNRAEAVALALRKHLLKI